MRRARWKRESFFSFRLRTPYSYGEAGMRCVLRRPNVRTRINFRLHVVLRHLQHRFPLYGALAPKAPAAVSGERFQRRTRLAALPRERPRGSRFAEPNVVLRGGERHFDYQLIGRRNHVSGHRVICRRRNVRKSSEKKDSLFHRALRSR